ncbi:Copia protein [Holothuria leucospilota]|uniref:Copia protein n=1 Tax=Holothuria leucospilota TaxID=206669 RepID=A0A9Q1HFB8_HOLLE|nr:Copia protein [Holothuria leucospilota]
MRRCLLLQSELGKDMWPYAVLAATYIGNRGINRRLKQTPNFALTGRKPNSSNMRVFGSECYAYRQEKGKIDPRCSKGIFGGTTRGVQHIWHTTQQNRKSSKTQSCQVCNKECF